MSWAKKNPSSSQNDETKTKSSGSALDSIDSATSKQFRFSSGTSENEIKLQVTKFKAIIEHLYSAGYYRSKITSISLFDRVIGGLCWSISNAGISVDVDILFQENMKTGSKVSLSEAVVSACREMKCPYPLQANQVSQCNDFGALLPIITWLCEKVLQWRNITGDRNRVYSEMVFSSEGYVLPSEDIQRQRAFLDSVADNYAPLRKYRMSQSKWKHQERKMVEDARVQACLLEYGHTFKRSKTGADGDRGEKKTGASGRLAGFDKEFAKMQKLAEREEEERAKAFEAREKQLMGDMQKIETSKVDVGGLAGIIGLESEEIREGAAARDEMVASIQQNENGGKKDPEAQYRRRKAASERQLEQANVKLQQATAEANEAAEKMKQVNDKLEERTKYNERVVNETKKVEEMESKSEFQNHLIRLKALVAMNEGLKRQEKTFKESCGREMKLMKEELNKLKNTSKDSNSKSEEEKRLDQIEEMYDTILKKYGKVRGILARKNQAIGMVARDIDDVPTRTELIQYERRFEELYQEIESTLEETRKYFDKYNVQVKIKNYITKEVELLSGINENFLPAMQSKSAQEDFIAEIEKKEIRLGEMQGSLEKKKIAAIEVNEDAQNKYQSFVDEQRAYFKAVKDFQTECDKNEMLTEKLEGR